MKKYLILLNEIISRKRLTQKEIEKNSFEQFEDTPIFETNNREEAEKKIKELAAEKIKIYETYDCYHKIYTYKRFELVKEITDDEDPDYSEYESLGIFYPNYEDFKKNDDKNNKEDVYEL